MGDFKKGILKFLTVGGMLIWWFVDLFSAQKRCRTCNCKNLMNAINDPAVLKDLKRTDEAISKAVTVGTVVAAGTKEIAKGTKEVRDTFFVN